MKDLKINNSAESISSEDFDNFTNEFNLNLPASYKEFILKNNGGYPEISAFGDPLDGGFHIGTFLRISLVEESILDLIGKNEVTSSRFLIKSRQIDSQNLPKEYYPFGLDDGGSVFCINMKDGSIWKIFSSSETKPVFIIDSFEKFINGLESQNDK